LETIAPASLNVTATALFGTSVVFGFLVKGFQIAAKALPLPTVEQKRPDVKVGGVSIPAKIS
jgi:hypothetical protein